MTWLLLLIPVVVYLVGAVGIWLTLMLLPYHMDTDHRLFVVTLMAASWPYGVWQWVRGSRR